MKIVKGIEAARQVLTQGRGLNLNDVSPQVLESIEKAFGRPMTPAEEVGYIIAEVRERGDAAVREMTLKLDRLDLDEFEVDKKTISEAYDGVDEEVVEALNLAAERVRKFHEMCRVKSWTDYDDGYGQVVTAVRSAGAYVPGGTAPYPSTVLMTAIPARVAGVEEVIMCTPSSRGDAPSPEVLVAADIAGVDRVFRIGGPQAIAAMS